ncbi:MAG: FAD:protein FMN transferase [Devosia sp.]|nr:FAD:protein FMN transferase [Devosia sp.]
MRETELIMGMPITIEVVGAPSAAPLAAAFACFRAVDERFSPYKDDSEVSALNRGQVEPAAMSTELREVLALSEATKAATRGYFDIRRPDGKIDPSGLVKGWAIRNAAALIADAGYVDYYVEAGGDIQCAGHNASGGLWRVGIRNPFNDTEIVKALQLGNAGIATSGNYVRGAHIYDPHIATWDLADLVSLTVVAADVYDADRYATAAFAMGRDGINFIEATPGLEGYAIDRNGIATMTSGFKRLVA